MYKYHSLQREAELLLLRHGGRGILITPPTFLQTPPHLLSKALVDFKESRGDQSFLHPTRQIAQNIRFSRSNLIENVWDLFPFCPPQTVGSVTMNTWMTPGSVHRVVSSLIPDRHHIQRIRPSRAPIEQHEHDPLNPTKFRRGISCWMLPCGPTVCNQLNWLDGCCSPQLLQFAPSSKLLFASFCTTQALSLCRHAVARLLPLHCHTRVSGWVQASLVKL